MNFAPCRVEDLTEEQLAELKSFRDGHSAPPVPELRALLAMMSDEQLLEAISSIFPRDLILPMLTPSRRGPPSASS